MLYILLLSQLNLNQEEIFFFLSLNYKLQKGSSLLLPTLTMKNDFIKQSENIISLQFVFMGLI